MIKYIYLLTGVVFSFSSNAFADTPYSSYCLESLGKISSIEKPIQLVDPAGFGQYKWILTWNGDSIFRESDVKAMGKQIGTSRQEIWGLKKFKESGDGSNGVAPALQVKNAHKYMINKLLFKIANTPATTQNAKLVDEALASCEGVSTGTTVDGEPMGKTSPRNAGDAARMQREKIRSEFPDLFKDNSLGPAPGVTR